MVVLTKKSRNGCAYKKHPGMIVQTKKHPGMVMPTKKHPGMVVPTKNIQEWLCQQKTSRNGCAKKNIQVWLC